MSDEVERLPLNEEIERYFRSLGMFVTRFAEAEAVLRIQCAVASKMDVGMAGLVFGDLAVQAAIEMLKRLRTESGLPDDAELSRALKQLLVIANTRNAILHRGVRMSDGGFVTATGLPNSRLASRPVDPDVLDDMHADLAPILAALALARPANYPGYASWAESVRIAARSPWRYTPRP